MQYVFTKAVLEKKQVEVDKIKVFSQQSRW